MKGKIFVAFLCGIFTGLLHAELPSDPIPKTLILPAEYPDSWVFAYGGNGKYVIIDVAAETKQHKGMFQGATMSDFIESRLRPELYVVETFYTRLGHGKRTDVLTVYDKSSLNIITEIVLPEKKRALLGSLNKYAMQITRDERFLLIFNFTPAASVTVIDIHQRQVVNEVPIPGCSLLYPNGERGFSSLCANGTLASFVLDRRGQVVSEYVSEAFNDIDNDHLFMHPAMIQGVAYFPSKSGRIQPVNMNSNMPAILPSWPLINTEDAKKAWRIADGSLLVSDGKRLFVRMHQIKEDGKHKENSSQVWVFDVQAQKRLSRFTLKRGAATIAVTQGHQPYLVAVAEDIEPGNGVSLDVYDAQSGKHIRNIGGWLPGFHFAALYPVK